MQVIIVGAGQVGFHTADRLSREGHHVVVIEQNPRTELLLSEKVNAMVVHGSGASAEVLQQVSIANADLFIAVTDQDEVNIVACIVAKQLGAKRIVARVKSGEFAAGGGTFDASKLGIDMIINPETVVAEEIVNIVGYAAATDVAEFANGRVLFLGYRIGATSELVGLSMRDFGAMRGIYRLVVTAIARNDQTIVPRGDDILQAGDTVFLVCHKRDLPAINYLFGVKREVNSNLVFILGAGRVGRVLATRLANEGYRVKVIDRNPNHSEALAQQNNQVLVLQTDGTDIATLKSEGIDKAGAFIAVTQDDQSNILCSLLAKKHGAKRAIAIVNNQEYIHLAPTLGVDACISPRLSTAAAILKYVRRGDVLRMSVVEQANAEILELVLHAGSPNLGTPLQDLAVPRGANIGAIVRGADVIIPTGTDVLLPEDHVVIFTLPGSIHEVEQFFASK